MIRFKEGNALFHPEPGKQTSQDRCFGPKDWVLSLQPVKMVSWGSMRWLAQLVKVFAARLTNLSLMLDSWNLHDGKRELTSPSCPLTSTRIAWHELEIACACVFIIYSFD